MSAKLHIYIYSIFKKNFYYFISFFSMNLVAPCIGGKKKQNSTKQNTFSLRYFLSTQLSIDCNELNLDLSGILRI